MIELKNVSKSYGKTKVLEHLNLVIPDGSVFGLVGINGAGKSTLLRLLAGVFLQEEGEIRMDGENIYENEKKKRELFFLPDDPFYSGNLNGEKLAELYRTFYDFDQEQFLDFTRKFQLDLRTPLRDFSKGMKRQVFVAVALASRPKYLLLDEAFDGLDPLARLTFKRGLIDLCKDGDCTVVIASHSLRELEDICDSYGLLDHHTITGSGEIEGELEKLHKFQIVFDHEITKEEWGIPCLNFSASGRVVKVICRGEKAELLAKIQAKSPLLVDEVPVDFEELFMSEVESRGYLQ